MFFNFCCVQLLFLQKMGNFYFYESWKYDCFVLTREASRNTKLTGQIWITIYLSVIKLYLWDGLYFVYNFIDIQSLWCILWGVTLIVWT